MSLIFTNTPYDFQPVLSDGLYFTISSSTYNLASTFKFRYVYNLFVEGVNVFEGRCTPNNYGVGIIDLQQVLETYTDSFPISYWDTTPIYTHQTIAFSRPANEEVINYQIKVGFEYASSPLAPTTGFTGIGDTIGNPAFESNFYKTFRSTMGTNGRATQASFNIDPFILSGSPIGQYPTTSGLFLTNAPRILDIAPDDYYTLAFTNYYLFSGATTGVSEGYYVKYTFYDDQGQLISSSTYDNILSNGGGPRNLCTDVYPALYLIEPWTETDYNTLYVGAGPENIPGFPSNCAQYQVQLFGKFTGTTSPIQPTPTPTPTPSSTGLPPRPTPSPTQTPVCTGCTEYAVRYTGESSSSQIFITNCDNGSSQSLIILPNQTYYVCSCGAPFTDPDVQVSTLGVCSPQTTATPTPTPTKSCECNEYLLENTAPFSTSYEYTDCDTGLLIIAGLSAYDNITICSCSIPQGSYVLVDYLNPCFSTPTPTPSATSTPPPATPTPTSSPAGGYAYYYLVRDCDDPGTQRCFASNSVFVPGKVVKSTLIVGCWEILDFCSAPEDDVITLSYDNCESCPR